MKAGDQTRCPHCGDETFVKEEVVMDGWTVKGKQLVCTLCGRKLGEVAAATPAARDNDAEKARLSALSGLLGEKPATKIKLDTTGDLRRFCKDCIHFVIHPFMTRCGKFDRDVDPMSDCPEYCKRPLNEEKK